MIRVEKIVIIEVLKEKLFGVEYFYFVDFFMFMVE